MRTTYHVPVLERDQDQLKATIKHLFPVLDPTVTQRATGTSNIDWQHVGPLSDLLDAKIVYSPYLTFTVESDLSEEQERFLNQSGIEINRELSPEDLLGDLE